MRGQEPLQMQRPELQLLLARLGAVRLFPFTASQRRQLVVPSGDVPFPLLSENRQGNNQQQSYGDCSTHKCLLPAQNAYAIAAALGTKFARRNRYARLPMST
jgi:hypothetical protein